MSAMAELITDLGTIKRLAQEREQTYVELRAFIKWRLDWDDAKLDGVVREIARPIYEAVDCTSCANCCRTMLVGVHPGDTPRLARRLRLSEAEFEKRYLAVSKEGEKVIAESPCPFLRGSRCSAYEVRPRDCREFPHLLKGDFRSRSVSTFTNAADCPIVFNAVERLMPAVGFR